MTKVKTAKEIRGVNVFNGAELKEILGLSAEVRYNDETGEARVYLNEDVNFVYCEFHNVRVTFYGNNKLSFLFTEIENCMVYFVADDAPIKVLFEGSKAWNTTLKAMGAKESIDAKANTSEFVKCDIFMKNIKAKHCEFRRCNVTLWITSDKKDKVLLTQFIDDNKMWLNQYDNQRSADKHVAYTVSSFGTYRGPVSYFPSINRVVAGCWKGTLLAFEKQVTMVIESDTEEYLNVPIMDGTVAFFKAVCANHE